MKCKPFDELLQFNQLLYQLLFLFQNAMKQQNIDFKEIDKDVLGTDSEFKAPPSGSNS